MPACPTSGGIAAHAEDADMEASRCDLGRLGP
jgi:hypothetical protein